MRRTGKPELKPRKGWRFRLILSDDEGRVVYDDYNHEGVLRPGLDLLLRDYEKLKKYPKFPRRVFAMLDQ